MDIEENEDPEVEESEASDSESSNTDEEDAMVITEPENVDGEQGKMGDSNTMSVSIGGNTEQLEEDNDTDSNSSEEEGDLVGNKSENPEDVEQANNSKSNNSKFDSRTVLKDIENPVFSKPEQPENREQLNIAELEKTAEHVPELGEEVIVADNKTNGPGGRFVNYFSASHRIPKAIDVMCAKGNVIPLSEICRMYLGINRDTVAVYMSQKFLPSYSRPLSRLVHIYLRILCFCFA